MKGPEVLGAFKTGPMNKCAICPFAGRCTPCKPAAMTSEGLSLVSSSPITQTIKEITESNIFSKNNVIILRPTGIEVIPRRAGIGEPGPVSSENNSSRCSKDPATCQCQEHRKGA